jgi:hypothetical protein
MQHVDECDFSGVSRKRPFVKITATRFLDDEVYVAMMDVPTKTTLITTKGFIRNILLFALCANTTHDACGGKIDPIMVTIYSVVLPMCYT